MKQIITIYIILLFVGIQSIQASPELPRMNVKDTVVINFGNNSKIMILVDGPEELKKMSEFDLNKMLEDLSISVDSMDSDQQYLKIEDETGAKYLNDTSIVVGEISSVDLEEFKESLKEEVKDELREEYEEKYRKNKKKYKRTRNYFNFEFGMNNYLQDGKYPNEEDALYTVKNWGSWFAAVSNTNRTHVAGSFYLDWGANISWYNFKYQNPRTRLDKGADEVTFWEDDLVEGPIKSKLTVSYINASLVPLFSFGKSGRKRDLFHWDYYDHGFRFGLGGYVGYRLWSFTKFTWSESGKKKKNHEYGDYYLNNMRYGLRFVMGYRAFDMFVNYDLNDLFIENKGPKLNALSFGIIL